VTPDSARVRVKVGASGGALRAPMVGVNVDGGTREIDQRVGNINFQYIGKEHRCWLTS
jgi:hypothetical protein